MQRALLSVSDKTGIVELAKGLAENGVELISTGGTASLLKENGLQVIGIEDITGFPECLDGRVKTLQPQIHGGILANREIAGHISQADELGIPLIDLVVVNLYPFKQTIARPDVTRQEAIENIDIGGVTLIRAAGKNADHVLLLTDPKDYPAFLEKLYGNSLTKEFAHELALKGFRHTAEYDAMISEYLAAELNDDEMPDTLTLTFEKQQGLRYGENPHQQAAFYRDPGNIKGLLSEAKQLNGKELSYNNIGDASAALEMAREYDEPVVVAVKHANPCGIAIAENVHDAYLKAFAADPQSIFGGIVVLNSQVEANTAEELKKIFLEIIIAPSFSTEALDLLKKKKNLRLLELPQLMEPGRGRPWQMKKVDGGLLIQDLDRVQIDEDTLKVATKREPSDAEWRDLRFAWKVVKHTKSNAIVTAKNGATLGVGGGQTSRVWAVENALSRVESSTEGAVLASDAFFPFADSVELAHKAGITAVIQPGGSVRDQDSIDFCDQHDMTIVFTGIRHFKH